MKTRHRIRSPHPGIKIVRKVRSDGKATWYARFKDPDSGRVVQTNLTRLGHGSAEARSAWAIKRAHTLAERRSEIESGLPVRGNTPIDTAITNYFNERAGELAASTLAVYRQATAPFSEWARTGGLRFTDDVNPAKLMQFRVAFGAKVAKAVATGRGAGRGKRVEGRKGRSAAQVNKCLRALRTVLNHWRRLGLTPQLDSDSIADSMPYLRAPRPMGRILNVTGVRDLLRAAREHDSEVFDLTRQEKHMRLSGGATARYIGIAPFVAAALLTGCRVGELLNLKWGDLSDDFSTLVLPHTATKTRHARRVDLRITPLLVRMLKALRPAGNRSGHVFGGESPFTYDLVESARDRLISNFKAPQFTWHTLRRTCGTFLACAPGIYGGASAYMAARRLGHSVDVAERHYLGVITDLPSKARTLEAALNVESALKEITRDAGARHEHRQVVARGPHPVFQGSQAPL